MKDKVYKNNFTRLKGSYTLDEKEQEKLNKGMYLNTGYKEEDDVKSPKNINKIRETVEKVCKNGKRI